MYTYRLDQWIAFFFIYCFFGWIFESTYVSLKKKHFVNRGFLRLPLLPLYGTGAVMMLWVSLPVKDSIVLVYLAGVIAATALEYVTGYVMERLFKMKYWDYSNQRFQLHGYICLSSSIAWGFLTIFLTEVIHRPIERFVLDLNPVLESAVIAVVGVLFVTDVVRSTKTALDLGRMLESMTKMKADIEELQVQLALLKGDTKQKVEELRDGLREETALRVAELKASAAGHTARAVSHTARAVSHTTRVAEELQQKLTAIYEKRSSLSTLLKNQSAYIFRNNPTASSGRFAEAFREIKESLENRRK